jgi:alpha-L-rhamnosidase
MPAGTYTATTTDNITGTYVNQLFKNIQRSQLGNFFTIPTDCPQRNERIDWTGDAQAYTRTGTYNSDARNFLRQLMVALRNDQGVGSATEAAGGIGSTVPTYNRADGTNFPDGTTWAAAVCMVPWQLYIQYGDKQIIEENIEAMMAWLNGMDFYNFSDKYTHLSSKTSGLSDWLAVDNNTPPQLVNNAIYIYMMEATAIMADAIRKTEYAKTLKERHALAKTEWNEVYVDPATGKTRNQTELWYIPRPPMQLRSTLIHSVMRIIRRLRLIWLSWL